MVELLPTSTTIYYTRILQVPQLGVTLSMCPTYPIKNNNEYTS